MEILIALIIGVAIFFTTTYIATMITEYKKYETFMKNGEIKDAIKEAVAKAEIEVTRVEEEKPKKTRKTTKKKVEEK